MPYEGSYMWRLRQKVGSSLVLMPGACTLVTNPEGQLLLSLRTDADLWCLPGGGAEEKSNFLDTARRELKEEVGIEAPAERFIPYASLSEERYHLIHYPNGDLMHCYALCFALEAWQGPASACDEVRAVAYYDFDGLPPNMFLPSLAAIKLYKAFKETGRFQLA